MDAKQGYWQMVWWVFKRSVDWAIKCVGVFGIAIGAVTAYEHFFSSGESIIPISIIGLTIWQLGAVILFFGFLASFIALTIDYFMNKRGKGITFKKDIKTITEHRNEIINGIQVMNIKKVEVLFESVNKLSPEQIAALFYGKVGEKQEHKKGKVNRKST